MVRYELVAFPRKDIVGHFLLSVVLGAFNDLLYAVAQGQIAMSATET